MSLIKDNDKGPHTGIEKYGMTELSAISKGFMDKLKNKGIVLQEAYPLEDGDDWLRFSRKLFEYSHIDASVEAMIISMKLRGVIERARDNEDSDSDSIPDDFEPKIRVGAQFRPSWDLWDITNDSTMTRSIPYLEAQAHLSEGKWKDGIESIVSILRKRDLDRDTRLVWGRKFNTRRYYYEEDDRDVGGARMNRVLSEVLRTLNSQNWSVRFLYQVIDTPLLMKERLILWVVSKALTSLWTGYRPKSGIGSSPENLLESLTEHPEIAGLEQFQKAISVLLESDRYPIRVLESMIPFTLLVDSDMVHKALHERLMWIHDWEQWKGRPVHS